MNKLKVLRRTFNTLFNRHSPYYAHLCVTQRCNLQCRFCQIWKEPPEELSTEVWKKIINKLANMGVALSAFTGGEPLLRRDIYELIDYAAATGLATAITSNGVNSPKKYYELLQTAIHKITISLDSVEGEDLPYSHSGKKILENIEFINKHKGNKIFTISTVLFNGNRKSVLKVIQYCEEKGIKVFVQPVVSGTTNSTIRKDNINAGALRRNGKKAKPLSSQSANVLNPSFFNRAAAEYESKGGLNWNCLGGEQFFDIKPNGEFWICQDYPTTLNITDPDFEKKWKHYDFGSVRKQCKSGCIYSCYYLTQKGFDIKNIPAMIKMTRCYM